MAWTTPRTYTAGEIITASILNSAVRDNLRYLKGLDGVVTTESGLIIDNTDGDEYFKPPLLSTAETGTVLDAEGKVAFDETTHQVKIHNGTAVKAVISEADVDDTPVNGVTTYPISSNWAYDHLGLLTTQGDIIYATAASTWARLAKGTAGQYLRMNSGATAPEWSTITQIVRDSAAFVFNSSSPVAIITIPANSLVIYAAVNITTALDGNGAVQWGIGDAGNELGFVSHGNNAGTGWYLSDATNGGAYLYDVNKYHPKHYSAATDIGYYLRDASPTQGAGTAYLWYVTA